MSTIDTILNTYAIQEHHDVIRDIVSAFDHQKAQRKLIALLAGKGKVTILNASAVVKEILESFDNTSSNDIGKKDEPHKFSKKDELLKHMSDTHHISQEIVSRLSSAVDTFLAGVRNELLFVEQLTKDVTQGGLGLSLSHANEIVKSVVLFKKNEITSSQPPQQQSQPSSTTSLEDLFSDIHDEGAVIDEEPYSFYDSHTPITDPKDFARHIQEHRQTIQENVDIAPLHPSTEVVASPSPEVSPKTDKPASDDIQRVVKKPKKDTSRIVPEQIDALIEKERSYTPPAQSKTTSRPERPTPAQPQLRKKIEDVVYTPRVLTPIDELRSFRLEDFRRLASSPRAAADKIAQRIGVLEHDSLIKKAEGIQALKESGLYKMYADIMQKSLLEGKPFSEVISTQETLTMEEFEALMELNKKLQS